MYTPQDPVKWKDVRAIHMCPCYRQEMSHWHCSWQICKKFLMSTGDYFGMPLFPMMVTLSLQTQKWSNLWPKTIGPSCTRNKTCQTYPNHGYLHSQLLMCGSESKQNLLNGLSPPTLLIYGLCFDGETIDWHLVQMSGKSGALRTFLTSLYSLS